MKKLFLMMVALGCLNSYAVKTSVPIIGFKVENSERWRSVTGNTVKEHKEDTNPIIWDKISLPNLLTRLGNIANSSSNERPACITVKYKIKPDEEYKEFVIVSKNGGDKLNYQLEGEETTYDKIYSDPNLNSTNTKRIFIENLIKILKVKPINKLQGSDELKELSLKFGLIIRISEHLRSLTAPLTAYMNFYRCKNEKNDAEFEKIFNKLFARKKKEILKKEAGKIIEEENWKQFTKDFNAARNDKKLTKTKMELLNKNLELLRKNGIGVVKKENNRTDFFELDSLPFVGEGGADAARDVSPEEAVIRCKFAFISSPVYYIFDILPETDKIRLSAEFDNKIISLGNSDEAKQKHMFKNDVISTYLAKCNDYESTVFKELTSSGEYTKYLFNDALPFYEE